jgi:hypothetical protein
LSRFRGNHRYLQAFQPRFILWGTLARGADRAVDEGPGSAADPGSVEALNLSTFVAVAKEFGDAGQVEVAERELSRWHRDER